MALADNEKNNIQELLGSAVPNGESMLSELLGQTTSVKIGNIEEIDAGAVGSALPGNNLIAPVELSDGLGTAVLIISEAQAAIMADLMIGQDGSNPPETLEDLHLSAVTELTGQFVDAVVSNVSSQISKTVMTTPGEVTVTDLSSGIIPGVDGDVVLMSAELQIGSFNPGNMGILFNGGIAGLMKQGAQDASSSPDQDFVGGVTAGSESTPETSPKAQNVVSSELASEKGGSVYDESLDIVLDVPLNLTVELGRTEKLVREVLDLTPGSVVELDKLAGEPVDILVNGKYIAKGEVVVIDENFGIRITDIIKPADRIPKI
ncbi:MAG: flagellar motor switch protein FliN [Candidatus Goldiibacteriota bacterium]